MGERAVPGEEPEDAQTLEELVRVQDRVDQVLLDRIAGSAPALQVAGIATGYYDRLTRRVVEIACRDLEAEGWERPAVPFCWLTMGSGGRREQVLRTDQDNAIVYGDAAGGDAAASAYFSTLARRVVLGLERLGFSPCRGGIMATNPALCRAEGDWYRAMDRWVSWPVPDVVRLVGIFLDFRCVSGDEPLAARLRARATAVFGGSPYFLYCLVRDVLLRPLPLDARGRLAPERTGERRGEIDLKGSACVPVVDCLRAFALKAGSPETATLGRLAAAVEAGLLPAAAGAVVARSFEVLMSLRLRANLARLAAGRRPDDHVALADLGAEERAALREALEGVRLLRGLAAETLASGPYV